MSFSVVMWILMASTFVGLVVAFVLSGGRPASGRRPGRLLSRRYGPRRRRQRDCPPRSDHVREEHRRSRPRARGEVR